jgi:dTDP-4-dehydrorhamnose reductase
MVTGAGGMVGTAVCEHCESCGDTVFQYDHKSLDVADAIRVMEIVGKAEPDLIINCAAWTDVDGCEADSNRAFAVNAQGPENLARASRHYGASFITISTDYVFDGKKAGFYTQRDDPNPQSVYAASKLEGERRAQNECARSTVVRTGFVFGPGGKNFMSTVVERARAGETLLAISDAFGTPTYSHDLAKRLRELGQLDLPGLYHVVNSGEGASFEEFARAAIDIAGGDGSRINAVTIDSLKRLAPRPRNSRLRCLLSEALKLKPLPVWPTALREFLQNNNERNSAGAIR